jgi:iron complex transport system ATP-binding protein
MTPAMTPLLVAHHLHVQLTGKTVVCDVSITLTPGTLTALIGPNGSGKTSLLRAVLGHIPAAGDIQWYGKSLPLWNKKHLARQVAYVPQNPTCDVHDRVIDALRIARSPHQNLLGLESETDEHIITSTAVAMQIDDLLHRPMHTLSGGQQQRVFLARALVQQPTTLILDEPSTFMDLRHQVELHARLRHIANEQKIGILMTSHDLNLVAAHADQVLILKAGHLLATGPVTTAMTPAILSHAFDVPIHKYVIGNRAVFVGG